MYLLCMGNFNLEGQDYTKGDHRYVVWFFLILASFIMVVVFMNMLIAIMTSTFGRVKNEKE